MAMIISLGKSLIVLALIFYLRLSNTRSRNGMTVAMSEQRILLIHLNQTFIHLPMNQQ